MFENLPLARKLDRAVKPFMVVIANELIELSSRIADRQKALPSDAGGFCGPEKSLDFPVTLGVAHRGEGVTDSRIADELLEVLGNELASPIRDDPRFMPRETLQGPLYDELHVLFFHGCPQLMMYHVTRVPVDDRYKKPPDPDKKK